MRLTDGDGSRSTLKLTRDTSAESRALLELQIALLEHLAGRSLAIECPRALPDCTGARFRTVVDHDGHEHFLWVLSYVEGQLLDDIPRYDLLLLESIGTAVAVVDQALQDFDDPRADRHLGWDLNHLTQSRALCRCVPEPSQRRRVERIFDAFAGGIQAKLAARPRSVIHNDGGNQHNMIVRAAPDGSARVVGLIDFGDTVRTPTVCGLGIAIAYAMFGVDDPCDALCHVTRAYHAILPLEPADLSLLPWLAAGRLAVSVCIAAERRAANPDDEYGAISAAPAWRVLERLGDLDRTAGDLERMLRGCLHQPG